MSHTKDETRSKVRDHYAAVAARTSAAYAPGCCVGASGGASLALGYTADDLASVL